MQDCFKKRVKNSFNQNNISYFLSSRRDNIESLNNNIMSSSYRLTKRVVTLLDTYQFDGASIWRLSEGKHAVVKLELTWQPPNQQNQHTRQKKAPGKKKEAESEHSTGIYSSAKTAPPAGEWPRQPSPSRTPPPKPAIQSPPKSSPAKSPTVEMVSPPGMPDITPPPRSRWTPKIPPKSPPCQLPEKEGLRVAKILHGDASGTGVIIYHLQHLKKIDRRPRRRHKRFTLQSKHHYQEYCVEYC